MTASDQVPGRRAARARDRASRAAAQAVVLALVAGGTSAFAAMHKDVTVDVDGTEVQVQTFGRTVSDVLAAGGIEVSEGDLVAPGLDQPVGRTGQVVVRHGREIAVEVDGEQREVWTTALTVGEAVEELGLRDGVRLSASRSATVGRDVLRVSTEKTVHLVVDGQVIDGVTSGSTVRDALREIGLVLEEADQVSVPLDAAAVDGLVVLVTRAATGGETVTEAVPFAEVEVEDPLLVKGNRAVKTKGKAGLRTTTYSLDVVGGVVVGRTVLASVVTVAPVDQVTRVGTAELPDPSTVAVEPGTAQAMGKEMAAARGWGDDQFACLLSLWNKESGWRWNAENKSSGAYGIPQSLPGSKMASVADDWRTNPATQITWGLNYIAGRYGDPCGAWAHSQAKNWY
ncbi:ubiquitin-like domain-containing protein [Cellulomonas sp. S1-8]|uniref:aggregation-promoting factor C-terminal-like domain-containing protein n=1 Tax=Cellulomonas sp. S1-8 TaxID=2904790 RepID=UPI002244033D|nr:ubiquitin-like domain-containing protein [Cellulomonas sp. S1-8]UZN04267.1 ubiquitin-like domain-containing protein [Cellulomonas sp. S1-8]